MDRFDFSGKKIVVTGASSGIGRATAVLLSETGAKVIIIARREEQLKKTLSLMKGEQHSYKVLDLSNFDAVIATMTAIVEEDGIKIDYVAHCAGVATPTPLRILTEEFIDITMQTNFYSFAAILRCVALRKLFNYGGAVVGVSSCAAPYGDSSNGIYAASKGAMDSLMRSAAKELRPRGIRVNTVCPRGIRTEMLVNQKYKSFSGDSLETLPDDLMPPERVAGVIAALLSDSMQGVSGVSLDVDGAKK